MITEGDRYKVDVQGKEYFVYLKKYNVSKKGSFWWAEAEEEVPGWSKTASGRSGLLLGLKDEVETQLKQNGLVLVVSNWKGGDRKGGFRLGGDRLGRDRKRRTRRRRQKRRNLDLVK
jgi:hypothetical protein